MMLLYIAVVAISVCVHPLLGLVSVPLCIGVHILVSVITDGNKKSSRERDDTPETEYDEFDRWQDNQGL